MQKNNFDFLRFVFAFTVILAHIYELTKNWNILPGWNHIDSFIPVAGFFIISGFLITNSYARSKNLKDYFIKRAKRLLPAYIFIIVVCTVLFSLVSTLSFSDYVSSKMLYQYLAANLVFLNFLNPCLPGVFSHNAIGTVDGSLWTIKIEVGFYLVLPVIYYYLSLSKRKSFFLTALYLLALLYNYLLSRYFQTHVNDALYFTLSHQLPSLMPYFIAGIALHYYFDAILRHKLTLVLIAVPVFLIEYYLGYQLLRPLALSIIIFYLAYSFKWFNNFGKYGDISYGIYIFHFPVIQLFDNYGLYAHHSPWLSVSLTLATSILLGILSWNFIEKRFLKRKIAPIVKPNGV